MLDAGGIVPGAAYSQYTEESYNNATSFGRQFLTMQSKTAATDSVGFCKPA